MTKRGRAALTGSRDTYSFAEHVHRIGRQSLDQQSVSLDRTYRIETGFFSNGE